MTGTSTLRQTLTELVIQRGESAAKSFLRGKGYSLTEATKVVRSIQSDIAKLANVPCYVGQWTIHPSHITRYIPHGGREQDGLCPGKTRETVLGFRTGVTREMDAKEFTAFLVEIAKGGRS
jgi:hypothetical protein